MKTNRFIVSENAQTALCAGRRLQLSGIMIWNPNTGKFEKL